MLRIMPKILMLTIMSITSICSAEEYHFASIAKLMEQKIGQVVITEVYNKLGITITIQPLPANLAQTGAESGRKDGEIMRIWTYGDENLSVIRVPTPYYSFKTTAFIRKGSNLTINSKEDLKGLRLVKVTGVKHTNNITAGMANVYDIYNTESMMKYLTAGRADVALTAAIDGLAVLKSFGSNEIIAIEKPLATLNLYHYIHKKHKALVPRVDKVIREMKQSGELEELIKKAQQEVMIK